MLAMGKAAQAFSRDRKLGTAAGVCRMGRANYTVRVRAVVHEHSDLQACVVARLGNEFIRNRLYEAKRRRCEAEKLGVAVEECAVLGSWQLTSLRLSSPVCRYFWHQQPSPTVSVVISLFPLPRPSVAIIRK